MVILNRRLRRLVLPAHLAMVVILVGALLGLAVPVHAQAPADEAEYQVKAAFLYKFLAYVEWPASALQSADAPIVIGVLAAEPLAEELSRVVASRTAGGRPVSVRRVGIGDPVGHLHVLFVGRSQGARVTSIVARAAGHALLVVTESDEGLAPGSIINFTVVDDKVRFDVGLHRAEQAGLRISARLLSVARKVVTSP